MRRAEGARSIEPQTRAPARRPAVGASSHCYRDRQKIFEKEEEKHCQSKLNLFLSFSTAPVRVSSISIRGRRERAKDFHDLPSRELSRVCIHDCRHPSRFLVDRSSNSPAFIGNVCRRRRESLSRTVESREINRIEFQRVICAENWIPRRWKDRLVGRTWKFDPSPPVKPFLFYLRTRILL